MGKTLRNIILSGLVAGGLVACSESEQPISLEPGKQKTHLVYSGDINDYHVDYGNIDYKDPNTGEVTNYNFMSVTLPDGTLLAMSDFDKDGVHDARNVFAPWDSSGTTSQNSTNLTPEACQEIYDDLRSKIRWDLFWKNLLRD